MQFKPLSEKEANAQATGLWDNGDYDFEVTAAKETTSQVGNDMFALEIDIFDAAGERKRLYDYLVLDAKSAWKLRQFSTACGLLNQYERGSLSADEIIGRSGRCTVGTQPEQNGYAAKNKVTKYLAAAAPRSAAPRGKVPADDLNDSIPF